MQSNKKEINKTYDNFFLDHTFNSAIKEINTLVNLTSSYLPENPKVLDIGCGAGRHLASLKKAIHGIDCYGIDLSRDCVKIEKINCPDFSEQIFEQDLLDENSKIKDKKFDLILILGATLGYFKSIEENLNYLSKVVEHSYKNTIIVFDFIQKSWAKSQFPELKTWSSIKSNFNILDSRKYEDGFLHSKKTFENNLTKKVNQYSDRVQCYNVNDFDFLKNKCDLLFSKNSLFNPIELTEKSANPVIIFKVK